MILYQVFENIGAFIGLMPLTGITLPFISFGGTSLMINMASIGLAMSVRLHGQEVEEDLPAPAAYPLPRSRDDNYRFWPEDCRTSDNGAPAVFLFIIKLVFICHACGHLNYCSRLI